MKKIILFLLVPFFLFSCSNNDFSAMNSEGNTLGGGNGTPTENTISR